MWYQCCSETILTRAFENQLGNCIVSFGIYWSQTHILHFKCSRLHRPAFFRLRAKFSASLFKNSNVSKYSERSTFIDPLTQIAKSLVMNPDSMVETHVCSKTSQNFLEVSIIVQFGSMKKSSSPCINGCNWIG